MAIFSSLSYGGPLSSPTGVPGRTGVDDLALPFPKKNGKEVLRNHHLKPETQFRCRLFESPAGAVFLGIGGEDAGTGPECSLVSVRKVPFSALAVSIFWFPCAAYLSTPPRKPSISLPGRKMPTFRIGNCQYLIQGFRMDTRRGRLRFGREKLGIFE